MAEATSALDLASEDAMYLLLQALGVTYISVGHRPSLLQYHDTQLLLNGPGQPVVVSDIDSDTKQLLTAGSPQIY